MALPKIREQIEARVQDTGDTMTGRLVQTLNGNPYYELNDGTNRWFFQAIKADNASYIGPTSTKALKIDVDGNAIVKGSLTVDGSIIGSIQEAIKATQDGNGNVITSTYLPLSGGTLTGTLYGTNIVPTTAGTGAIGMSGTPWLNVHSQYFRVYDPNNVQTGFLDAPIAGTTSTQGETYLAIGNATASGSNGNSRGRIRMYGTSSGYIDLYPTASTSNYTIALPAASGTVALTGHAHTAGDITSGTLGVERGGTGQTTAKNAANAFMNALETGGSTPVDADYYISQYVGGGTTTTTYHRRPMSALWSYINGKVSASYPTKTGSGASGTWGISISGNAATATSATKATKDGNGATIASTYLKLAGGTMTGNITRNYVGQSWIDVTHGRACAIKLSAAASGGSASCLWSVKTNAGAWGCGGLSGNDNMYFSYGTDTNYNAGTNTLSGQIIFTPSGGIVVASNTEYTTYKARNIAANTSALTSGSSSLASGNIYVQYE